MDGGPSSPCQASRRSKRLSGSSTYGPNGRIARNPACSYNAIASTWWIPVSRRSSVTPRSRAAPRSLEDRPTEPGSAERRPDVHPLDLAVADVVVRRGHDEDATAGGCPVIRSKHEEVDALFDKPPNAVAVPTRGRVTRLEVRLQLQDQLFRVGRSGRSAAISTAIVRRRPRPTRSRSRQAVGRAP